MSAQPLEGDRLGSTPTSSTYRQRDCASDRLNLSVLLWQGSSSYLAGWFWDQMTNSVSSVYEALGTVPGTLSVLNKCGLSKLFQRLTIYIQVGSAAWVCKEVERVHGTDSSLRNQNVYPLSWSPPQGAPTYTQPGTTKKHSWSDGSPHLSCKWPLRVLSPASGSIWAVLPGGWLLLSELWALSSCVWMSYRPCQECFYLFCLFYFGIINLYTYIFSVIYLKLIYFAT